MGEGGFMGNFWKEGRGGWGGEEEVLNECVVLVEMDVGDWFGYVVEEVGGLFLIVRVDWCISFGDCGFNGELYGVDVGGFFEVDV